MRLSAILFWASLAYAAGIFFASFFSSSFFLALFLSWMGAVLLGVFWQNWKVVRAGIALLAAAFGVFSYGASASLPPSVQPETISFAGTVVLPSERGEQSTKVVVRPEEGIKGRVLVHAPLFADIRQGDYVRVTGELETPSSFEGFNYPLFLAKEGMFHIVFRPDVAVVERRGSAFSKLRENLLSNIQGRLSPPESSLLSAMLLGDSSQLSEEFAQKLSSTGTRHITAVSGMHVAILSGMLLAFLLGAGFQRRTSSLLALLFLAAFVVITGAPASAVRAGIMGSAMLVGGIVGRRNVSLRALVFAGAGMLLSNPLLLGHDIGFQLSFLAVLGILLFLPVFQYALRRVPNPLGLRDVVFMSVAAQLFTLPLVLHHFSILSLVSLLSNLLVVPFLPLALLLGALFLAGSMFPLLGALLAFPAALVLSYIALAVELMASFPFAAVQASFPLWAATLVLFVPSLFAFRFQRERRFRFSEERMIL